MSELKEREKKNTMLKQDLDCGFKLASPWTLPPGDAQIMNEKLCFYR